MNKDLKDPNNKKKELRNFGITISLALAALAIFSWWRGNSSYIYLAAFSALMLISGLAFPFKLSIIYKIWMKFALILGQFMTKFILFLLFYLIFTPTRFISRLFGKAFLDLEIERSKNSYWINKESNKFNKTDYEKQY